MRLLTRSWPNWTSLNDSASISLAELATAIGGQLEGDGSVVVSGVAPIESAGAGDLSFVANNSYKKYVATTSASALILAPSISCEHIPVIRHDNPYLAYGQAVDILFPPNRLVETGVHPTAAVSPQARIAPGAAIGPLCYVGAGASIADGVQLVASVYVGPEVSIGKDCLFYPGVRIMHKSKIGECVILHSGVVIGSDGFGFAESPTGMKKIKQVGWVEIGGDVEIGANTTVDRGAIGPTRIGRGTKIDNLVQIAHNVEIGENSIIVAQAGISGSTKLGNRVILAGQVGLVGHIEIGDDVRVGAQSGVSKSIPAGKTVFGYPARDIATTLRIEAALPRLPDLLKRVTRLEKKLTDASDD